MCVSSQYHVQYLLTNILSLKKIVIINIMKLGKCNRTQYLLKITLTHVHRTEQIPHIAYILIQIDI